MTAPLPNSPTVSLLPISALTQKEKTIPRPKSEGSNGTRRAWRAVFATSVLGMLLLAFVAGYGRAAADDSTVGETPPTPALPIATTILGALPTFDLPASPPTAVPAPPTSPPAPPPTNPPVEVPIAPAQPPAPPVQPAQPAVPAATAPSAVEAVPSYKPPVQSLPPAPPQAPLPPPFTPTRARPNPTATPTPKPTSSWLPPGPGCSVKPGKIVVKLDVPYIHQVNDVDGADGNWACGPASVLMVLAYYSKLEPWPQYIAEHPAPAPKAGTRPAQAPSSRGTDSGDDMMKVNYAPYLTTAYTNNGHTYSATAPDPRGNRVAGLYGTIAPTGLADWGRIKQVLVWHGLQTQYVSPTWNGVVAALKRGHPVLLGNDLTAAGHIMVAVGYTSNNQIIVNDPYGNRFKAGYGANDGEGVYYSWNCSRVRNALEVVGVYTPPTPTAVPTTPPPPTDVPQPAPPPADGAGPGGAIGAGGPVDPASVVPTEEPDIVMFVVQTISKHPTEEPDAFAISDRLAATGKPGSSPSTHVLAAQRDDTRTKYLWLTLPILPALAGFGVTLVDRRRKRTADVMAISHDHS